MPGPISQAERDEAIRKINEILVKGKYDTKEYGIPEEPNPQVFTFQHPSMEKSDFRDDPIGTAALATFKEQYPDAYRRAGNIHMGMDQLSIKGKPMWGSTWKNPFNNNEPAVSVLSSDQLKSRYRDYSPFSEVMRVLRHEFGHVRGLEDDPNLRPGIPTTYDVGEWSDKINSDIQLPSPLAQDPMQKMGSMMPTTKVKVR